ncbi:hypothetical protein H072_497 [Dactylellina haptotyla CBS 200.50]|uniref:BTB domain-containing protein n=1 Tax=Dactylellina haptotyla (strain CBS 200.50) TaxID=1284197 RepID=S8CCX1_DACHA|nr:hypothetical protein H072_497 [Dactylellina haptotyla CBS 200.50]
MSETLLEILQSNELERDWRDSTLYNANPPDVKIFCGPKETETCFDLHLTTLTSQSEYFKAAFTLPFQESLSRTLHLDEIDADPFETIVQWLYCEEYTIKAANYDQNAITATYAAANYLQIPALKSALLRELASFLSKQVDLVYNYRRKEPRPFVLLQMLAEHAQVSEWIEMRECVRQTVKYGYLGPTELVELARNPQGASFLLAMAVECYNDLLNAFMCNKCQGGMKNPCDRNVRCKGCGGTCSNGCLTVMPRDLEYSIV